MDRLQTALEEIKYEGKKFPGNALKTIIANKEEAIPYLRDAVLEALDERELLEENNLLHFYAVFLLGEFQDRDFFPKLIEFVTLPGEVLDYLLGGAVTEGLRDILYNTYNGDIELLANTVSDNCVDEFVRAALLDVMGQLYLDGKIDEAQWKIFIKERVYSGEECSYFYNSLASAICRCHFVEMLPEIRYMLDNELMDEFVFGKYDSCVDYMFEYREYEKNFCESPMSTIKSLQGWAMFEEDPERRNSEAERKAIEQYLKKQNKGVEVEKTRKVGRNDPCPCGSGKKYKFCCLNKPEEPINLIESAQERKKCLEQYPYVGDERQEGRVYLEDCFDKKSIEIDKLLYLGLKHRPGLIWLRDEKAERKRCREYLILAFEQFQEKVTEDSIKTLTEYDQKNSIHYFCREWLDELLDLLKEDKDTTRYREVKKYYKKMEA